MAHVKWLAAITALTEPSRATSTRSPTGSRGRRRGACRSRGSCRARSRSRPGSPTSFTRERFIDRRRRACWRVAPGPAGARSTRVEVSVDGGGSWADAELASRPASAPGAAGPTPGTRRRPEPRICSRATDAAGNVQPVEPPWNLKGCDNEVERLRVTVREPLSRRERPCVKLSALGHVDLRPRQQLRVETARQSPGGSAGMSSPPSRSGSATTTSPPRRNATASGPGVERRVARRRTRPAAAPAAPAARGSATACARRGPPARRRRAARRAARARRVPVDRAAVVGVDERERHAARRPGRCRARPGRSA